MKIALLTLYFLSYDRPSFEAIVKRLTEYHKQLQNLYGDNTPVLGDDEDDEDDYSDSDDSDYGGDDHLGKEFTVIKMNSMPRIQKRVDNCWKGLLDEGKSLHSIRTALLAAADKIGQLENSASISSSSQKKKNNSLSDRGEAQKKEEIEDESKQLLVDSYVSFEVDDGGEEGQAEAQERSSRETFSKKQQQTQTTVQDSATNVDNVDSDHSNSNHAYFIVGSSSSRALLGGGTQPNLQEEEEEAFDAYVDLDL